MREAAARARTRTRTRRRPCGARCCGEQNNFDGDSLDELPEKLNVPQNVDYQRKTGAFLVKDRVV